MRNKSFASPDRQRGAIFVEAVAALAILTIVISAVIVGFSTFEISSRKSDGQTEAGALARQQMEHIFAQAYVPPGGTYLLVAAPLDLTVAADAIEYVPGDADIETVRVTVTRQGDALMTIETLRSSY